MNDVARGRRISVEMQYEIGEWTHVGFSYHDGTSTVSKNGDLHMEQNGWNTGTQNWTAPADQIQFGRYFYDDDVQLDEELDEVYIWEMRKPPSLFYTLAHQGLYT